MIQYCIVYYSIVQYRIVQFNIIQYSTVKNGTVEERREDYSIVQYSVVHDSIVQYSIVQYTTVQYSIVQYSILCSTNTLFHLCDILFLLLMMLPFLSSHLHLYHLDFIDFLINSRIHFTPLLQCYMCRIYIVECYFQICAICCRPNLHIRTFCCVGSANFFCED